MDSGVKTWIVRVLLWGVLDGTVRYSLLSGCLVSSGRQAPPKVCYFGRFYHSNPSSAKGVFIYNRTWSRPTPFPTDPHGYSASPPHAKKSQSCHVVHSLLRPTCRHLSRATPRQSTSTTTPRIQAHLFHLQHFGPTTSHSWLIPAFLLGLEWPLL